MSKRTRVIIIGAAGRDFHNFNVYFRTRSDYEVVAFTAAQIPGIDMRSYPPALAGPLYPEGIPIVPESELEQQIRSRQADEVVFAYSDVSFATVMHLASRAMACGADFRLLGPTHTQLQAKVPVIAVCAVRTGAGKSQTTRRVVSILKQQGVPKVAVLRHPMPYGDLQAQRLQRFATMEDLQRHNCTLEEREDYEPHLREGQVVYAGVDYADILAAAQEEAPIVIWDGGNNDLPFLVPDLLITVVDPLRPGDETRYYPGEINLRSAHLVVINKVDSARPEVVAELRRQIGLANPAATIVEAESRLTVDGERMRGKKVLVVEDGPTLTHGDMAFGAGVVAAERFGASIVDPRPFAVGSLAEVYRKFPHLGPVLPAMGYSAQQCEELRLTIENSGVDLVVCGTPIDLGTNLGLKLPVLRVAYDLVEKSDELNVAVTAIAAKVRRG